MKQPPGVSPKLPRQRVGATRNRSAVRQADGRRLTGRGEIRQRLGQSPGTSEAELRTMLAAYRATLAALASPADRLLIEAHIAEVEQDLSAYQLDARSAFA